MKRLGVVVLTLATVLACHGSTPLQRHLTACASGHEGAVKAMFHGDRARTGAIDHEADLAPDRIAGMHGLWTSAPFDTLDHDGTHYVGRAYASPLYADGVPITSGHITGSKLSVVFVATSNGDVYAYAAFDATCAEGATKAGDVLWRTHLVTPDVPPKLDGRSATDPKFPGIAVGALATPVLDGETLYVTAMDANGPQNGLPVWKIFAIDVPTGAVKPGWPVVMARPAVEARNTNGPAYFDDDARFMSQRSALALSPDGSRVYVTFGGYYDQAVGWVIAIDTGTPAIAASFAGAPDTLLVDGVITRRANAGIWAPGGPAIDDAGKVYVTTGNSPEGSENEERAWGDSLLRLSRDLALEAVYTPYDYCSLDDRDVDVAGSSAILLPPIAGTTTPNLITLGGKAGVVYLVDRDKLAPAGTKRRPCAISFEDAARDDSLLPPLAHEPYCEGFPKDPCVDPIASTRCVPGPLQVFGPPGDDASLDRAKMRSTPAYFRAADGASYVFVAGSTKAKRCTPDVVPPSVARLKIVTEAGKAAYLTRDAVDTEIAFVNPGSPVVTSNSGLGPVVWVVDLAAKRTQPLLDPGMPAPVLYAIDGTTMKLLWKTGPRDLEPGGKYVTPAIAHGTVFVATDRLHAFGLTR